MHCRSCEMLVEDELSKLAGVKKVVVSEKEGIAHLEYEGQAPSSSKIAAAVKDAGYEVGKDVKPWFSPKAATYKELGYAAVTLFILAYVGKSLGLFNLAAQTSGDYSSLGVVLVIGITAGVSTCMALVGGLVLGASARYAEKHPQATPLQKFTPHLFFNLGRIASFFFFGGLIGLLGSFFQISTGVLGFLIIAVGVVMFLMGAQLTDVSPKLNRFKLSLPKSIGRALGLKEKSEEEYSHQNALLSGALTFFLPCGFTQAMQLYAMSTGSVWKGALTMGVFAVGTAPGLLGIGGLTALVKGALARYFFKGVGIAVMILALFNINNGLNLTGVTSVFASLNQPFKSATTVASDPNVTLENGVQVVHMTQDGSGYSPNTFIIKKGIPVKWVVTSTNPNSCASVLTASKLGIRTSLKAGENVLEFTPDAAGTIPFSCIMGMYTGSFKVVDDAGQGNAADANATLAAATSVPSVGSCGGGGGGCGCGGGRPAPSVQVAPSANVDNGVQVLQATFTNKDDVVPNTFKVKANQPVRLEILAKEDGAGCMSSVMIPRLVNQPQLFTKNETIKLEFTPTSPGSYPITCAMGVKRGTLEVD